MGFPFVTTNQILKKLGGGKESGKVFTYDGTQTGLPTFGSFTYAAAGIGVFDLNNLKSCTIVSADGTEQEITNITVGTITLEGETLQAATTTIKGTQITGIIRFPYAYDDYVLFVFDVEGIGYVSRVEFTETIHPIDPKYLPESIGGGLPVVVDLNTFSTTDGIPFSLELMSLAVGSAQEGGTLQTKTVHDSGNALRTACSTDRHLLIVTGNGSADMTFPVGAGIQDGKATCVTFIGLTILGTVNAEIKTILQFYSGTDEVDIYCKATPLA